jgi:RNA polymerase sigma-70 factor (ECF subfamily)
LTCEPAGCLFYFQGSKEDEYFHTNGGAIGYNARGKSHRTLVLAGVNMLNKPTDFLPVIESARNDAGSKLGELLEHFQPLLKKFADRSIGQTLRRRMSPSDLVQETMLSATSQFQSFRGQSELELQSWLMELMRSRLTDGLRRHKFAARRTIDREVPCSGSSLGDASPTPSQLVDSQDDTKNLLDAIQLLSPEAQTIVRMRYLENQSFDSIAQELGMSLTTVWRHWATALERIKQRLQ